MTATLVTLVALAAVLAVDAGAGFLTTDDAQAIGADIERVHGLLIAISTNADVAVEVLIRPVLIPTEAISRDNEVCLVPDGRVSLPQVRHIFQHRDFALHQIAVELGILSGSVDTTGGVVHPAL